MNNYITYLVGFTSLEGEMLADTLLETDDVFLNKDYKNEFFTDNIITKIVISTTNRDFWLEVTEYLTKIPNPTKIKFIGYDIEQKKVVFDYNWIGIIANKDKLWLTVIRDWGYDSLEDFIYIKELDN